MKQHAIAIGCYALLNLVGGLIGFFVANSFASLIASAFFSSILFFCVLKIWKGNRMAYDIATSTTLILFLFFTYRFFLTHKIMPAALMSIVSGVLFVYQTMSRKKYPQIIVTQKF